MRPPAPHATSDLETLTPLDRTSRNVLPAPRLDRFERVIRALDAGVDAALEDQSASPVDRDDVAFTKDFRPDGARVRRRVDVQRSAGDHTHFSKLTGDDDRMRSAPAGGYQHARRRR